MLVTLPGMVMEVKPEQPENAQPPILVMPLPRVTEIKPEQPENAFISMLVTFSPLYVSGITTSVSVQVPMPTTAHVPSLFEAYAKPSEYTTASVTVLSVSAESVGVSGATSTSHAVKTEITNDRTIESVIILFMISPFM